MMRFLVMYLLAFVWIAGARENPFVPAGERTAVRPVAPDNGIVILTEAEAALLSSEENLSGPEESAATETLTATAETVNFQHIRFIVTPVQVRIETKDRLKKDFSLKNPTRIILDFESETDFPSRKQVLDTSPFAEIRLGSHKGYYRAVIELGDKAQYEIVPFKYGYILTLK